MERTLLNSDVTKLRREDQYLPDNNNNNNKICVAFLLISKISLE